MKAIVLLLFVVSTVLLGGCQLAGQPIKAGTITTNTKTSKTIPPVPPTFVLVGDKVTVANLLGQVTTWMTKNPQAFGVENKDEVVTVIQPQNPDGAASLNRGADGSLGASIPPANVPAAPAAPSPASKALGSLVYWGAGLIVLGIVGIAARVFLANPFGAVVPVGIFVVIAGGGVALVLFATVLSSAPWWAIAAVGISVLVAIGIGVYDNWSKLFPTTTTTTTTTGSPTVPPVITTTTQQPAATATAQTTQTAQQTTTGG